MVGSRSQRLSLVLGGWVQISEVDPRSQWLDSGLRGRAISRSLNPGLIGWVHILVVGSRSQWLFQVSAQVSEVRSRLRRSSPGLRGIAEVSEIEPSFH